MYCMDGQVGEMKANGGGSGGSNGGGGKASRGPMPPPYLKA